MAQRRADRDSSRGVAVLELTLSLVFLIPLMLATLDFGYYFYIGAAAEEAARQGVQQAAAIGTPCPAAGPVPCPAAVANAVTAMAVGSGTTCTNATPAQPPPAPACYLNAPPLYMGSGGGNTTVTCTCIQAVPTQYTVTVQVDFKAAVGFFRYLMPAGSGSYVRYRATLSGTGS